VVAVGRNEERIRNLFLDDLSEKNEKGEAPLRPGETLSPWLEEVLVMAADLPDDLEGQVRAREGCA
jgi:hypothetical protein